MKNNYLRYIFPIPRKQTKLWSVCMCTPNFSYKLNQNPLIQENEKVRALFISTKIKTKNK
jgi:hypothetical protein